MAETNDSGGLELVGDDAFGAPLAGTLGGDIVDLDADGSELPAEPEVPFAEACRVYRTQLGFRDVETVRQLVLAEPNGKDARALRDLIRELLRKAPPEAALYDGEVAAYVQAQHEEHQAATKDSVDYQRRIFAFYSTALMRLEARIARDPRAILTARAVRGGLRVPARGRRRRVGGS